MSESFKEALKINGVDLEKNIELTTLLKALIDIEKIKAGEVFSVTASWLDGSANIFIQRPDQTIQKISGPEKMVTDLFSIWFGQPADAKLEDLKKTLLK